MKHYESMETVSPVQKLYRKCANGTEKNLRELPDALLCCIYEWLGHFEDIQKLMRTCRQMNELRQFVVVSYLRMSYRTHSVDRPMFQRVTVLEICRANFAFWNPKWVKTVKKFIANSSTSTWPQTREFHNLTSLTVIHSDMLWFNVVRNWNLIEELHIAPDCQDRLGVNMISYYVGLAINVKTLVLNIYAKDSLQTEFVLPHMHLQRFEVSTCFVSQNMDYVVSMLTKCQNRQLDFVLLGQTVLSIDLCQQLFTALTVVKLGSVEFLYHKNYVQTICAAESQIKDKNVYGQTQMHIRVDKPSDFMNAFLLKKKKNLPVQCIHYHVFTEHLWTGNNYCIRPGWNISYDTAAFNAYEMHFNFNIRADSLNKLFNFGCQFCNHWKNLFVSMHQNNTFCKKIHLFVVIKLLKSRGSSEQCQAIIEEVKAEKAFTKNNFHFVVGLCSD